MLENLLKLLLVLVLIPVATTLYIDKAKSVKPGWQRWCFKNPWAYIIVVLVLLAISLEVRGGPPEKTAAQEKPLTFLAVSDYEKEIETINPKPTNWLQQKQQLLRLFEHAEYAYSVGGYDEAIDALLALEQGRDAVGSLLRVPSYVVSNDLGCAFFKKQRNRSFEASSRFATALSRLPSQSPHQRIVQDNLLNLDQMVNALD